MNHNEFNDWEADRARAEAVLAALRKNLTAAVERVQELTELVRSIERQLDHVDRFNYQVGRYLAAQPQMATAIPTAPTVGPSYGAGPGAAPFGQVGPSAPSRPMGTSAVSLHASRQPLQDNVSMPAAGANAGPSATLPSSVSERTVAEPLPIQESPRTPAVGIAEYGIFGGNPVHWGSSVSAVSAENGGFAFSSGSGADSSAPMPGVAQSAPPPGTASAPAGMSLQQLTATTGRAWTAYLRSQFERNQRYRDDEARACLQQALGGLFGSLRIPNDTSDYIVVKVHGMAEELVLPSKFNVGAGTPFLGGFYSVRAELAMGSPPEVVAAAAILAQNLRFPPAEGALEKGIIRIKAG